VADDDIDWLEGDLTEKRHKQEAEAVEDAQIYLLFSDNERGREILRRWERDLWNMRTPLDAPIQEYAAKEALRTFFAELKNKIDLAQRKMDV
jgi:hypothetical protein